MVDDHGPTEIDATNDDRVAATTATAEPTCRLLVVRHRQSTWNAERRFTGRQDPPLSEQGRVDAEALAERLAPLGFDTVVASTLTRARQTAELVAARLNGVAVVTDARLVEHHVPAWEGCTRDEIDARSPGAWARWREEGVIDAPGTEPWSAMEARVTEALLDHATRAARVLVVAHAGVLRALGTGPLGPPLKVGRAKGRWALAVDGRLVDGGIERLDRR